MRETLVDVLHTGVAISFRELFKKIYLIDEWSESHWQKPNQKVTTSLNLLETRSKR